MEHICCHGNDIDRPNISLVLPPLTRVQHFSLSLICWSCFTSELFFLWFLLMLFKVWGFSTLHHAVRNLVTVMYPLSKQLQQDNWANRKRYAAVNRIPWKQWSSLGILILFLNSVQLWWSFFLSMEKVLLFLDYLLFVDCNFYFKYIVSENRCKMRLVCSWNYHLEKDLFFKLQTVKIFNNKNFELEFNRFFLNSVFAVSKLTFHYTRLTDK